MDDDDSPSLFVPDELVHELRNPLTVILGYLELLETTEDEKARAQAVTRIRQAAMSIDALLERGDDG